MAKTNKNVPVEKKKNYNPANSTWGKTLIVILCLAMIIVPVIAIIAILCNR